MNGWLRLKNIESQWRIRRVLKPYPRADRALLGEQIRQVVQQLVAQGLKEHSLQVNLPAAAAVLTVEQLRASLDLVVRLAKVKLDPNLALQFVLTLGADAQVPPADYQASLDLLEHLFIQQQGHRYPQAFRKRTKRLLPSQARAGNYTLT